MRSEEQSQSSPGTTTGSIFFFFFCCCYGRMAFDRGEISLTAMSSTQTFLNIGSVPPRLAYMERCTIPSMWTKQQVDEENKKCVSSLNVSIVNFYWENATCFIFVVCSQFELYDIGYLFKSGLKSVFRHAVWTKDAADSDGHWLSSSNG